MVPAPSAKGSRQKTTARATSETISNPRRDQRSTRGPSATPIATIGMKSAIRSALTHFPEPVRSKTSTVSAIAARKVPAPEASVARKSRR